MDDCEKYGMFVTPELNAFWNEMDIERKRFDKECEIAQAELKLKEEAGQLAMIVVQKGVDGKHHPIVRTYKPSPKQADGDVKFMFDLSMVMLVGTVLGFLFYFILR